MFSESSVDHPDAHREGPRAWSDERSQLLAMA
jgi:hypothetical protein